MDSPDETFPQACARWRQAAERVLASSIHVVADGALARQFTPAMLIGQSTEQELASAVLFLLDTVQARDMLMQKCAVAMLQQLGLVQVVGNTILPTT